jgi:hypothetical protein
MASAITGTATGSQLNSTSTVTVPDNGDDLNAESVESNTSTPKTGFLGLLNYAELFRKVLRGEITGKAFAVDGTGGASVSTTAGDISASHDVLAGNNMTATALVTGGTGLTATTGNVTATAGNVAAGTKLTAATARSSATTGSGQSVAAGEVWKDTSVFAAGRVTYNAGGGGALALSRGFNVSSVSRNGVGKYDITLQTAATNLLQISVTPFTAALRFMNVDTSAGTLGPSTTVFRVLVYDQTFALADIPGTGTDGFFFIVLQN